MKTLTFNSVDFTTTHGVIVLDEFQPPELAAGRAMVMTFPGTDTRRAFRGSPESTVINVPVYIPSANWGAVVTALETITLEDLTINGDTWSAIWDGGPIEREPLRTGYIATLRFLA